MTTATEEVKTPELMAKDATLALVSDRPRRPLTRASASQIKTFRECPAKWFANKVLQLKTPTTASHAFGKNIHKQLEDYVQGLREVGQLQKEAVGLVSALKEHLGEDFMQQRNICEPEITFSGEDWAVPVIGYIDLLHQRREAEYKDTGIVVDYKTCRNFDYVPTVEALVNDPQKIMYTEEAFRRFKCTTVHFSLIFVMKGTTETRVVTATTVRGDLANHYLPLLALQQNLRDMKALGTLQEASIEVCNESACGNYGGCPFKHICVAKLASKKSIGATMVSIFGQQQAHQGDVTAAAADAVQQPAQGQQNQQPGQQPAQGQQNQQMSPEQIAQWQGQTQPHMTQDPQANQQPQQGHVQNPQQQIPQNQQGVQVQPSTGMQPGGLNPGLTPEQQAQAIADANQPVAQTQQQVQGQQQQGLAPLPAAGDLPGITIPADSVPVFRMRPAAPGKKHRKTKCEIMRAALIERWNELTPDHIKYVSDVAIWYPLSDVEIAAAEAKIAGNNAQPQNQQPQQTAALPQNQAPQQNAGFTPEQQALAHMATPSAEAVKQEMMQKTDHHTTGLRVFVGCKPDAPMSLRRLEDVLAPVMAEIEKENNVPYWNSLAYSEGQKILAMKATLGCRNGWVEGNVLVNPANMPLLEAAEAIIRHAAEVVRAV